MNRESNFREKEIYKVTIVGSLVNFLLVIFKFTAGIIGHSTAMMADAVHSLSDFATDVVVIICVKISGKPQDENHKYGHGKYETLATAIIGTLLLCVGVGIMINAASTIIGYAQGKTLDKPGNLALIAAAVSIIAKEGIYQYTAWKSKRLNSKAVTANAWHHRSDALSSIGTLVGIGGAILLGNKWTVLDPITALIVSFFIIRVAIKLAKPCIDELLEKSLPKETEQKIMDIIQSIPEVKNPHNLRTRHIGNNIAIECHVRMDGNMSLRAAHDITRTIESKLKNEFGNDTHIGIHAEPEN